MRAPTPQPKIRSATLADAQGLAEVKVETWRAAYAEILPRNFLDSLTVEAERALWENGMRAYPALFRVAEEAGQVVGYVVTGAAEGGAEGEGELYAIYVYPRLWNTGLGRRLMQQGLEDLAEEGFAEAVLWVFEENRRTRAFYEKAGFLPDGGLKMELGQPTLRYRRKLG